MLRPRWWSTGPQADHQPVNDKALNNDECKESSGAIGMLEWDLKIECNKAHHFGPTCPGSAGPGPAPNISINRDRLNAIKYNGELGEEEREKRLNFLQTIQEICTKLYTDILIGNLTH